MRNSIKNNFLKYPTNFRIVIALILLILAIAVMATMFFAQKVIFLSTSADNTKEILSELRENRTAYIPSGESNFAFLNCTFGELFDFLKRNYGEIKIERTTDSGIAIVFKEDKKKYFIYWLCSTGDCMLQSITENQALYEREEALKVLDRLQSNTE